MNKRDVELVPKGKLPAVITSTRHYSKLEVGDVGFIEKYITWKSDDYSDMELLIVFVRVSDGLITTVDPGHLRVIINNGESK